jgi:hypothetical protein
LLSQARIYEELETVLGHRPSGVYKHLCGEYPTSTAFALWLATNILKNGKVPAIMHAPVVSGPGKILIYNHYKNIHHSVYLLSSC